MSGSSQGAYALPTADICIPSHSSSHPVRSVVGESCRSAPCKVRDWGLLAPWRPDCICAPPSLSSTFLVILTYHLSPITYHGQLTGGRVRNYWAQLVSPRTHVEQYLAQDLFSSQVAVRHSQAETVPVGRTWPSCKPVDGAERPHTKRGAHPAALAARVLSPTVLNEGRLR